MPALLLAPPDPSAQVAPIIKNRPAAKPAVLAKPRRAALAPAKSDVPAKPSPASVPAKPAPTVQLDENGLPITR